MTSILNQLLMLMSGLVLPRLFIKYYGSEVNGLQSSIAQFLSVINFFELGVSSVVQANLYQPLVRGDKEKVNRIVSSACNFFKRLAILLVIYVMILCYLFPGLINSSLSDTSTRFLILAMSISLFSQFYFGVINQIILYADQKNFIQSLTSSVTILLNIGVSAALIFLGAGIVTVRFCSGVIFLLRPLYLQYFVNKHYDINKKSSYSKGDISQKWNAVAQHIAYIVLDSTDIVVLTIFSTLKNVSIYSIYNLVASGIKLLIASISSGYQSFFGHLIAQEKMEELNRYFSRIEWQIHTITCFLFAMTSSLIVPFVSIYTLGVKDANYNEPLFALVLSVAQMIFCIRIPYTAIILSAGHFKETQNSAILEALINVSFSIIMVSKFGLVGVAIGTLCAVVYRTIYFAYYLSKNLLKRDMKIFIRHAALDILSFASMVYIGGGIKLSNYTLLSWVKLACIKGCVFLGLVLVIQLLFNKQLIQSCLKLPKR